MAKETDGAGRRARAAQRRVEQDRAERRRKYVTYGVTGALVLAVVAATVGGVVYQNANDPGQRSYASFGVPLADAGCRPVVTDDATGAGEHVGPGTSSPDTTHVDYRTVPPSSGPHYATPVFPNVGFYGVRDVPAVEQLVHNLEHGYTIVWYDPDLPTDQQDQLRALAEKVRVETPKFIAAPWDTSRGELADGAMIAMSHWGADAGYRQLCTALSGEAVAAFVAAHPASDSPEPNAA
jgi:hypothetical protein